MDDSGTAMTSNSTGAMKPPLQYITLEQLESLLRIAYQFQNRGPEYWMWMNCALAVLGLFTNTLNIFILTRLQMRSSINLLLAALEMVNFFLYLDVFHEVCEWKWPIFYYSYANSFLKISLVYLHESFRGFSNWLTVTIAVWRLLAVKDPFNVKIRCSKSRAKKVIIALSLSSFLLAVPFVFIFAIESPSFVYLRSGRYNLYTLRQSKFANSNFWFVWMCYALALMSTTIPCLVLGISSFLLIYHLIKARQARNAMTTETGSETRVSITLLVLLLLFFVTYLPSSIRSIMVVSLLFEQVRKLPKFISKATPLMVLLTNSTTVFFYFYMSENFRKTFYNIVKRPSIKATGSSLTETDKC